MSLYPEAEFLDVVGPKVLRVFLLAIHSQLYKQILTPPPPPPLEKSGLKAVCNVNIVYRNLNSENSHDYAQKPWRNCTFMNLASVHTFWTLWRVSCMQDQSYDPTVKKANSYWSMVNTAKLTHCPQKSLLSLSLSRLFFKGTISIQSDFRFEQQPPYLVAGSLSYCWRVWDTGPRWFHSARNTYVVDNEV